MLCSGVTDIRPKPGAPTFRLGGLELVDLREGRPIHQVPVLLWAGGLAMTHNPVWIAERARAARLLPARGRLVPEERSCSCAVDFEALAATEHDQIGGVRATLTW